LAAVRIIGRDSSIKWGEGRCSSEEMCSVTHEYNAWKSVAKQKLSNPGQNE
jgi:hypothetical protein